MSRRPTAPKRAAAVALLLLAVLLAAAAPRPAAAFSLGSTFEQLKSKLAHLSQLGGHDKPAAAQPADGGAAAAQAAFESITGGGEPDAGRSSGGSSSSKKGSKPPGRPLIRTLSWQPRAYLWENFLTEQGGWELGGRAGGWVFCRRLAKSKLQRPSCAPSYRLLIRASNARAEADHIIELGATHLIESDVVDSDTGNIIKSKERTSR
jgi:hypothetical protein